MGKSNGPDRTSANFKYIKGDGKPDLVYTERTNAFICPQCGGLGCFNCFGTGYTFLDTVAFKDLVPICAIIAQNQ